jgi:Recombination endonuclease VII
VTDSPLLWPAAHAARRDRYRDTQSRNRDAPPGTRWCSTCETYKPLDEIASGTSWCKECRNADRRRRWSELTPDEKRASGHKSHGRPLSPDQYAARVAAQDGKCPICGCTPEPRTGGRPRADGTRTLASGLVYDHCHETGRGRDLLCHRCNVMLGHAQDNPELLQAAAAYLRRWASEPLPAPQPAPAPKPAPQPRTAPPRITEPEPWQPARPWLAAQRKARNKTAGLVPIAAALHVLPAVTATWYAPGLDADTIATIRTYARRASLQAVRQAT